VIEHATLNHNHTAAPHHTAAPPLPDDPISRLRKAFPWPAVKPEVNDSAEFPGWFGAGTDAMMARVLPEHARVVVELGAWLGMSTRHIAKLAPHATIISVDHWEGSPEHLAGAQFQRMLPTLFDSFLSECWQYRDRIIPLRFSTIDGLRTIANYGIEPDLIFIDAEHSYDAVTAELELSTELFPQARLVGDDFDWRGVQDAVQHFAQRHGMRVERDGARGWALSKSVATFSTNGNGKPHEPSKDRSKFIVLVPHLGGIEGPCESGLKDLELAGVRVIRRQGSSQIDLARSDMMSEALHDGYESILFIDADIGFNATDAIRLMERPEPVVAGVYAKKGPREVTSIFAEGTKCVLFGPDAKELYPLKYAATGFLRVRSEVLRLMIEKLRLPLCNTLWNRGMWPFFLSMIVPQGEGKFHYLGEDWSFSYRLSQIGVTPMADTSFRLSHYGPYPYSWEDVSDQAAHPLQAGRRAVSTSGLNLRARGTAARTRAERILPLHQHLVYTLVGVARSGAQRLQNRLRQHRRPRA
jgi:hypothetical protein